jgi:hypothetical protein
MSPAVLNSSLCAASAIIHMQKLQAQSDDSLELEIYISQFLLGLHSMQTYRRCRMIKMCMTDNLKCSFLLELLNALRKAGALADDYDKTRTHKFMITKSAVSTCIYVTCCTMYTESFGPRTKHLQSQCTCKSKILIQQHLLTYGDNCYIVVQALQAIRAVLSPLIGNDAALAALSYLPGSDRVTIIRTKSSVLESVNTSTDAVSFSHVELDVLLEDAMDYRMQLQIKLEDHIQFVFSQYMNVYSVIKEAAFGTDFTEPQDCMITQISKAKAAERVGRPVYSGILQHAIQQSATESQSSNSKCSWVLDTSGAVTTAASYDSDQTCTELIQRHTFVMALQYINPLSTREDCAALFGVAQEIMRHRCIKSCDKIWAQETDANERTYW